VRFHLLQVAHDDIPGHGILPLLCASDLSQR